MRRLTRSLIALTFCSLLPAAGGHASHALSLAAPPSAIVDVNVVTMDVDAVLPRQTVIIAAGRIVALGPVDTVAVPAGATVIDGAGRYLMPALTDMHVHVETPADLRFYLAYGVTTVRNMNGRPQHLRWRDEIAQGTRVGPRMVTAGPCMGELPCACDGVTAAAYAARVAAQQAQGYEFIKVYDYLPADAYAAVLAAASELDLDVVGHVPDTVRLDRVLASGQRSIEHLDGYSSLQADDRPALIAQTVEHGVWNTPTLVIWQRFRPADCALSPAQLAMRRYAAHHAKSTLCTPADFATRAYALGPVSAQRRDLVAALHAAGAPLLLGTDAPHLCTVPGYATHQELQNFVDAGLTPYAALRTATVNPARFWHELDTRGTVAVGKVADLLLLRADPLADVRATLEIVGVMQDGVWMTPADLFQHVEQGASRHEVRSRPLREAEDYAMFADR